MSDKGIFILQTFSKKSVPSNILYEYRVAYTEDIDKIYGKFNDETKHWNGDISSIIEIFGKSQVFEDEGEAWREAFYHYNRMFADHEDFSIAIINTFKDKISL